MVKILFFGDLVETLGTAMEEIDLPADITDIQRLVFHLSGRGEMWAQMLRGNPKLKVTVNRQFAEKSTTIKDGDEIALVGFAVI